MRAFLRARRNSLRTAAAVGADPSSASATASTISAARSFLVAHRRHPLRRAEHAPDGDKERGNVFLSSHDGRNLRPSVASGNRFPLLVGVQAGQDVSHRVVVGRWPLDVRRGTTVGMEY